jgi:glycosyltransferase involved in cell wall biosynthesis
MGMPLVSVLIPAFNSARWISESLESVLSQTDANLEVIVADNGSSDGTPDVVRQGFGGRVRVVHEATRGAGAARNRLLDEAKGDFLQFLDADDLLEPGKIRRQLDILQASGGDVVWGPFWTYERQATESHFTKRRRIAPQIGDDVACSILKPTGFLQLGCLLIRRTPFVESLRMDNGESAPTEDVRYVLELALGGARFVEQEEDSGLLFRQHSDYRWSSVSSSRFWSACATNARLVEGYWRGRGELSAEQSATLIDVFINAARAFWSADRDRFALTLVHLNEIDPNWQRRLPTRLRLTSRLFGYATAERLASAYRQLRRAASRG